MATAPIRCLALDSPQGGYADVGEEGPPDEFGKMIYRLMVVAYFVLLPSYFWYRWCVDFAPPLLNVLFCGWELSDFGCPALRRQAVHHRMGRALPHVLPDNYLCRRDVRCRARSLAPTQLWKMTAPALHAST